MADPEVFVDISRTEEGDGHPSIHAGYNDGLTLEVDEGSLVGSTDAGRGPARKVVVAAPLTFAGNELGVNLADVYGEIADAHDAETSAREAAISGEATARADADSALDARLDVIEARPMGQVTAYANAAAFPASPAPPSGTTVLGFDRNTNQLRVWDPDAGAWIAV